jgi:hypothetical protein
MTAREAREAFARLRSHDERLEFVETFDALDWSKVAQVTRGAAIGGYYSEGSWIAVALYVPRNLPGSKIVQLYE